MSDFVKRLTGLFGISKPSPMAKGALGLSTDTPEVKKILNEMPKSNRQTGVEEKFKNEWNTENNKAMTPEEGLVNKEETEQGEEEGQELDENGKPIVKKPNIFETLQEFVAPQTTYVSTVVKRHMEKRAFDNPDPNADPQEDMDTRLLDPQNPEYKRKKGFGQPFGDAYDGGELKCNLPASARSIEHSAVIDPKDAVKIIKDFAKISNWKLLNTATGQKMFINNVFSFEGTQAGADKNPWYVTFRSQDTFNSKRNEPFQARLMFWLYPKAKKNQSQVSNISGGYSETHVLPFASLEELLQFAGMVNIPTKAIKFKTPDTMDFINKKLKDCDISTSVDDKSIFLAKAIDLASGQAVSDGVEVEAVGVIMKFVLRQFSTGGEALVNKKGWGKKLFEIMKSNEDIFPVDMQTKLLFENYQILGYSIVDVLNMEFSKQVKKQFVEKEIEKEESIDGKHRILNQLNTVEKQWKKAFSADEWWVVLEKYMPSKVQEFKLQKSLDTGMREFPHMKDSKKLTDSVRAIVSHYNDQSPEWVAFQEKIRNKKVTRDEFKNFLNSIGIDTKHWTDFLPAKKLSYDKKEVNDFFATLIGRMGEGLEKLTEFYTNERGGKKMGEYVKAREEYESLIESTSGRERKEDRVRAEPKLKILKDKMNEIKRKYGFSNQQIAYYELMELALDENIDEVPAVNIRALFASLESEYAGLYPTESIMGSLNKSSYTIEETQKLMDDFAKILEAVEKKKTQEVAPKNKKQDRDENKPPKPFNDMTPQEQNDWKALQKKLKEERVKEQPVEKVEEKPAEKKKPYTPPFAYVTDYKVLENGTGRDVNKFNIYLKFHPNFTPAPVDVLEAINTHGHGNFGGIESKGAICWATIYYMALPEGKGSFWVLHEMQSDVVSQYGKRSTPGNMAYKSVVQNYYEDWASALFKEVLRIAKEHNVPTLYVRTAQAPQAEWQSNLPNILTRVEKGTLDEAVAKNDLFYRIYYSTIKPYADKIEGGWLARIDDGKLRRQYERELGVTVQSAKDDLWRELSKAFKAGEYHIVNVASTPLESIAEGTQGIRKFALNYRCNDDIVVTAFPESGEKTVDEWVDIVANWIDRYIPRVIAEEVLHLPPDNLDPQSGSNQGNGYTVKQLRAMVSDDYIQSKEQELFEVFWWGSRSQNTCCPMELQYNEEVIPAIVKGLRARNYRVTLPASFLSYYEGEKTFDIE